MAQTAPSLYDSFSLYGSGVTLVTVADGNDAHFFIAASVMTASVEPFSLAVSVSRYRAALPAIVQGRPWAVSMLAECHLPLVRALTGPTAHDERLEALRQAGAERSPEGPLWLPDALVTLWCTSVSTTSVYDQVLLVGRVERGSEHHRGTPLLRWNRDFRTTARLDDRPAQV